MTYYEVRCVTPDKKKYTIGPFRHKKRAEEQVIACREMGFLRASVHKINGGE